MNVLPTIQPNSQAIAFLIVITCVGLIAIIILLSHYLNLWQQVRSLSNYRFSSKKYRELALNAEFTEKERLFFENYLKNNPIPRFLDVFYHAKFNQSIMRQIYRATFTQPENFVGDIEEARFYIFSITQKIENSLHKSVFVKSTRKIPRGSRFYLNTIVQNSEDKPQQFRFVGKLYSNHRNYFEIQLLNGSPSQVVKGSDSKIEIIKTGDRAIYSSKVRGYSKTRKHQHTKNKKLLTLEHCRRKPEIIFGARRYKRKQLQVSVAIIPLAQVENKLEVDGSIINALLCDISTTGCGILSHVQLPKKSLIGVSYLNPYDSQTIHFVSEIVGYTKLRNTNINAVILQNRIEKITYKDRNLIAAFVYEFESEHDKIKMQEEKKNYPVSNFDSKTVAVLSNHSS